ncbi:hypothetical protein NHX12_020675 [Muraenolepis orangiensis]|uniref:Adrenomedullin n=1 Tax=Muraenolepis orangiensis TaxID=630683 RepID=A0A9Q0IVD9_9TELE|nr:hypothetical protein NHX12_020675 [Muraenolepis orangiensis]
MPSLLPLTVYCISLLTLQQLSWALPAPGERLATDRSDLLKKPSDPTDTEAPVPEAQSEVSTAELSPAVPPSSDRLALSLERAVSSNARVAAALSSLAWARPDSGRRVLRRSLRTRRNARHHQRKRQHNSHHSKLNKEGCPLGTCSVHNLSHRLYQLIGQSGREDSSPINPRSPHSFG